MVVDLTVFWGVANFASSHASGDDGVLLTLDPIRDVEIVDVLLDVMIA